jgi:phytoene/squalene synthetase
MNKFDRVSYKISEQVTRTYSTSFYTASLLFDKEIRDEIFSIYGFVRLADEIVDSFHNYDKVYLLTKFECDYYDALQKDISLNPVLQSFQRTVKKYNIPDEHVRKFLESMKKDLAKKEYTEEESCEYIYGSADVVGLMCLKVFCNGNDNLYQELEEPARKLGSAFQKVNFLRDLQNDMENLGRSYFQEIRNDVFPEETKLKIIREIESDFESARSGIKKLPKNSRLAVNIAFIYYQALLKKLKRTPAHKIKKERIRISNTMKYFLFFRTIVFNQLNII